MQPREIYENVKDKDRDKSGKKRMNPSISNILSLEFTNINDNGDYSVEQLIEDTLNSGNSGERRRLAAVDDALQTINVSNTSYCNQFVFLMYHTNDSNVSDSTEYMNYDLSNYDENSDNISFNIGVCRYYDTDSQTWSTDGCVAIWSNSTVTKCLCSHLTAFGVSSSDFEPEINTIDATRLQNVTFGNLAKHPTALIGILTILFVFWNVIMCLPRSNDKPIVSQMRPWSQLQRRKWEKCYDYKFDQILINENENHWFLQFLKLTWLDIRNNHYVLSLILRDYSTNWSAPQRVFCFLASMVTMASINAAYYGKMSLNYNSLEMGVIANYIYSSLGGSLIPMILSCMFTYHRPSVAVRYTRGLYEILKEKYYEKQFEFGTKEHIKLDAKQIEFDVLSLMAQKDYEKVKHHKKLKAYNLKQLFTKDELLQEGIERHVKTGKKYYKKMNKISKNGNQNSEQNEINTENVSNNERRPSQVVPGMPEMSASPTIATQLDMATNGMYNVVNDESSIEITATTTATVMVMQPGGTQTGDYNAHSPLKTSNYRNDIAKIRKRSSTMMNDNFYDLSNFYGNNYNDNIENNENNEHNGNESEISIDSDIMGRNSIYYKEDAYESSVASNNNGNNGSGNVFEVVPPPQARRVSTTVTKDINDVFNTVPSHGMRSRSSSRAGSRRASMAGVNGTHGVNGVRNKRAESLALHLEYAGISKDDIFRATTLRGSGMRDMLARSINSENSAMSGNSGTSRVGGSVSNYSYNSGNCGNSGNSGLYALPEQHTQTSNGKDSGGGAGVGEESRLSLSKSKSKSNFDDLDGLQIIIGGENIAAPDSSQVENEQNEENEIEMNEIETGTKNRGEESGYLERKDSKIANAKIDIELIEITENNDENSNENENSSNGNIADIEIIDANDSNENIENGINVGQTTQGGESVTASVTASVAEKKNNNKKNKKNKNQNKNKNKKKKGLKVTYNTLMENHGAMLMSQIELSNTIVVPQTVATKDIIDTVDTDKSDDSDMSEISKLEREREKEGSQSAVETGSAKHGKNGENMEHRESSENSKNSNVTDGESGGSTNKRKNSIFTRRDRGENSEKSEKNERRAVQMNTILMSTNDHAMLMLIQSHLIETLYWVPHWSALVAWIIGILWILFCAGVIVIYGVNFDLVSRNKVSDDIKSAFFQSIELNELYNCSYVTNNDNNSSFNLFDSDINEYYSVYNGPITALINYELSSEWAEMNVETLYSDNGGIWGDDVSDSTSWILSFLMSFFISILVWTPLTAALIAFGKFAMYQFVWTETTHDNSYYTQYDIVRNDENNENNNENSVAHFGNSEVSYRLKYVNQEEIDKNLKEENIESENDLWELIDKEINVKALCQYPLWVLEHPYINKLRSFLNENNENNNDNSEENNNNNDNNGESMNDNDIYGFHRDSMMDDGGLFYENVNNTNYESSCNTNGHLNDDTSSIDSDNNIVVNNNNNKIDDFYNNYSNYHSQLNVMSLAPIVSLNNDESAEDEIDFV